MEWTREKTLSLISEYRKRRGLWDMTHDDYRKKDMKLKLLMEVSASLGGNISIVEIEKKFHTLRTQYHREINRMKRKEPYNSKWFGFKNLQFLSSPKACRSSKGRIKSEITEDGTVTTKYIIREALPPPHDTTSAGSANSSTTINDEFLTIHRKPTTSTSTTTTTITYEAVANGAANATDAASTSRSHELEKLIEETTKDVEDIEEAKPKITTIKEITVPLDHHHQSYTTQIHGGATSASSGNEISTDDHDAMHQPQESQNHQQQIDEDDARIETIDIQTAGEDEITYQTSSSTGHTHHHHQQQTIPTRIIKIQRRDTCHDEDYYHHDEQQQQQSQHHIHAVPSNSKRIYYEANGQQHTATILTTPTSSPPSNLSNTTLINQPKFHPPHQHLQGRNIALTPQHSSSRDTAQTSPPQLQQQPLMLRDEFATYGEYVGNEMRGITNREILVALKHKINTALFEASMAELQK